MPPKPKLRQSRVVFNEENHTYRLDDVELSGVTALLHRTLFTDMYDGVSQETLDRAAQRGTFIHKMIEDYHTEGIDFGDEELEEYRITMGDIANGWLASEYLVSDEKRYASKIDLVYYHNKQFLLADIKTVSKLDQKYLDYCSWQLSVYAYMFERQNPHRDVSELYVIWIPKPRYGKPKLVQVQRKTAAQVEALFRADEQHTVIEKTDVVNLPVTTEKKNEITSVVYKMKQLQDAYDQIKKELLTLMQRDNIYEAQIGSMRLTRKAAYDREGIDTKKLKEREPLIAERYKKVTKVAESILIKFT